MTRKRYAVVLPAGGEPILVLCKSDGTLGLKEMQSIVGGYIETTSTAFSNQAVMIVNEEGKLQELTPNMLASQCVNFKDVICGDAIIMQVDGEELIGFSKATAKAIVEEII